MSAKQGKHRANQPSHRSEGFAVRRWLRVGAASAGMGAALLGYSLLGPQTGVAGADTGGESSVSRSAGADTPRADRDDRRAARAGDADRSTADTRRSGVERDDTATVDIDIDDSDIDADDSDIDADDSDSDVDVAADVVEADEPAKPAPVRDRRTHSRLADSETQAAVVDSGAPQAIPPGVLADAPAENPGTARQQRVAEIIDNWTTRRLAWIDSLPVDSDRKAELEASMWATRRAFMNQTPTVAPIQVSGKLTGPIEGTIGAVDPDGDEIRYVLTVRPREGTVVINDDGTYTYTPDDNFDGVDTFRVSAIDGFRINIFDLFRGVGTRAKQTINQGAIKFSFDYTTGAQYWTDDRRQALQNVTDELIVYFVVERPILLNFEVLGQEQVEGTTLASAWSDYVSGRPGFWRTVVQHKLLTGRDANGSKFDGHIEWNFANPWGYGDEVGDDEYDFDSTALHELLHTFGFLAGVHAPGENTHRDWAVFSRFIVDENGKSPITLFYRWNSAFDENLEGGAEGLYFGGEHAVAANGGHLIPLYTPDEWEQGSSMSHLDDHTYVDDDQKLMNARTDKGLGIRTLSAIELGILRDLGYTVVPVSPDHYAWAFAGLVLLGRRRKKAVDEG